VVSPLKLTRAVRLVRSVVAMWKSFGAIAFTALIATGQAFASPGSNQEWSGPLNWDISGTGNIPGYTGFSGSSLDQCKAHCLNVPTCNAAQHSETGRYGPNNCFIFNTNGPNGGFVAIAKVIASFQMYTLMPGSWSGPMEIDINGIGFSQTKQASLDACQQHCLATPDCRAAQFPVQLSSGANYQGNNCFLYAKSQVDNKNFRINSQLNAGGGKFLLYKFNPKGCEGSTYGCCKDNYQEQGMYGFGCDCGTFAGCCQDGVTPKTSTFSCPSGLANAARRLLDIVTV